MDQREMMGAAIQLEASAPAPLPAGALRSLLESWLQTPAGARRCGAGGHAALEDAMAACPSLRALAGGSPRALAEAVRRAPAWGALALDAEQRSVRLRGLRERVRCAAEWHVAAEGGAVSLSTVAGAAAVAGLLEGLPSRRERLEVLADAARGSRSLELRGAWLLPRAGLLPRAAAAPPQAAAAPPPQPLPRAPAAAAPATSAAAAVRPQCEAGGGGEQQLAVEASIHSDLFEHGDSQDACSDASTIEGLAAASHCTKQSSEETTSTVSESSAKEQDSVGSSLSSCCCHQLAAVPSSSRQEEAVPALWAARHRSGSDHVERMIRAILNKLTIEKFAQLAKQLAECGITTEEHLELLTEEIFNKATTQHHFTDMYADLCRLLHERFTSEASGGFQDPRRFRRLLLGRCQEAFERDFGSSRAAPPSCGEGAVGNMRFVGALLARRLLTAHVLPSLLAELLDWPTARSLEAAAALLAAAGPALDAPASASRPIMAAAFARLAALAAGGCGGPRTRCLVQGALELRAAGWRGGRAAGRPEPPTTLRGVAERAKEEARRRPPRRP